MQYHSRSSRRCLPALAFVLVFLGLPLVAGAQEAGDAEAGAAGVIRTELALDNRPLSFAYDSTLRATVPRPLLASDESAAESRIRLGELTVNPFLAIGTLDAAARREAGEPPVAGPTTVWLTRADDGWALELEQAPAEGAAEGTEEGEESGDAAEGSGEAEAEATAEADDVVVAHIPLAREADEPQDALSAVLVPTSDDSGQIVLRWHDHRWSADFDLLPLPTLAEQAAAAAAAAAAREEEEEEDEDEGPRVPTAAEQLEFDSDTSAVARALALTERNDTAIVLPDETRISVLVWQEQLVDHGDFAALATMGDGEVVRLREGAVIRLQNDVPLQFGDTPIPTDNLAPDFPGAYGLWLKRAGDGWRLVFNHEPDSWGTQHDPAFDAVEIDLEHSEEGLATRSLGATLFPVTAHSGRLVIHWGAHEWAADFTISE